MNACMHILFKRLRLPIPTIFKLFILAAIGCY
jgi:hypothetical protein